MASNLLKTFEKIERGRQKCIAKANASASGGLSQASELPDEGVRMAICSLAAIPMLCVFPFFQKYFVKGITVGSVKG